MNRYALVALALVELSFGAPHRQVWRRQDPNALPDNTPLTTTAAFASNSSGTVIAAATSVVLTPPGAVLGAPTAAAATSSVVPPTAAPSGAVPTVVSNSTSASNTTSASGAGSTVYTFYKGDGSVGAGWPDKSAWVSDFDTMFNSNKDEMAQACVNLKSGDNDSDAELGGIHEAISSISGTSGVDARFILAIVMQESKGCVRIKTTVAPDGSVKNPGLMQTFNGTGTCAGVTPCPQAEINQMITDGATGRQGLKDTLAAAPAKNSAQGFYQAARFYNSGLTSGSSDLGAPGATRCYASDVANRLTGWNELNGGNTKCTLV